MNLGAIAVQIKRGAPQTFKAKGTSMEPIIRSGQMVTVNPLRGRAPEVGEVVLAKVNGRWYLHLVTARRRGQVQISNNKGHVNGWTALTNVIGVVQNN